MTVPELAPAHVALTWRDDGDFAVGRVAPWPSITPFPVTWLRQVHGAAVIAVEEPGTARGTEADAAVTAAPGVALAVRVADCAPVALASPAGVVGVVHAGWLGLVAGVLPAAVARMRSLGAGAVTAALGPCVRAECYEFGAADLERVASELGESVRSRTSWGAPALDIPAAVRAALAGVDAELVYDEEICTSCSADRCFSHRARGERQRQAMVVWRE